MGRKQSESEGNRWPCLVLLGITLLSSTLVYIALSVAFQPRSPSIMSFSQFGSVEGGIGVGDCCRGIEQLELWGPAVKWGSDFKFNSSDKCCEACKSMCSGDGPCLCNSWVFCGDKDRCENKFGECWLKKQKDPLSPDVQALQDKEKVIWTSGLVYGKGEGIIGLETQHGTIHLKLLPDCAPHSVAYIIELLKLHHCAGCHIYRAEGRGNSWDSEGNHIMESPLGPPFALIQGTLEAQGVTFKGIPAEACPSIRRGSVAWIGSGPDFFISLANHEEWGSVYTVFGSVLPEDMEIAEKIAQLPTTSDVWKNIQVSVLENPISLKLKKYEVMSLDIRAKGS
ncbi:hypothetical protein AMTRI_Chr03g52320 [Amborella trichopoda]